MMAKMKNCSIAVIDYGAGNLRSVSNAIESLGYVPNITSRPEEALKAKAVVLPGVGAAGDTVAGLKSLRMDEAIREIVKEHIPLLGVCIGLQVLFTGTEEGGWHECLKIIPGKVKKLHAELKIPHMGWNQVKQLKSHPIFYGIPDNTNFYFVHSYHAVPDNKSVVIGETEYGAKITSVVARDSLVATQFHPEKSGAYGLRMYQNFFDLAGIKRAA